MGKSYNKRTGFFSQSDSHHSSHDRGWSRRLKNDSYKSIRKHNKSGVNETNCENMDCKNKNPKCLSANYNINTSEHKNLNYKNYSQDDIFYPIRPNDELTK